MLSSFARPTPAITPPPGPAIDAGLHVLVEKPLATTLADARDLVVAADAAGVILMAAHNHRYKPAYRALRQAIARGDLGRIHCVRAEATLCIVPFTTPDHWIYNPSIAGGGVALNLALHRIDLCRYLVGEISRVSAATCRAIHPRFAAAVPPLEDYAIATFECVTPAGPALAEIFAAYTPAPAAQAESITVFGDRATARTAGPNDPILIASAPAPGQPTAWISLATDATDLPHADMFTNQLAHFVHCIRTGEAPLTSGRDALRSLCAVFALYESACRGAPISLDEFS